jgi:hypothetical protein
MYDASIICTKMFDGYEHGERLYCPLMTPSLFSLYLGIMGIKGRAWLDTLMPSQR